MNIALLGFGTVGSHFYELAKDRDDLTVAAVLSRRPRPELTCTVTADFDEIVRDKSIDVVVEVMGGIEPAYSYITAAMRAGKHVVTANKQLMCERYDELLELARECGVHLRCTAAVGGGVPWLEALAHAASVDEITRVEGILNGTTNYILTSMTLDGMSYEEALKKAQEMGLAEADPSSDVDGLDALRKLVISANLAFGVSLKAADIPCIGITQIGKREIRLARARGLTFKLVARADRVGDKVSAYVCPTLYPDSEPEAHTDGVFNLMFFHAKRIGVQGYSGEGAGGFPTASSVLADCLTVMREGEGYFYTDKHVPCEIDNSLTEAEWFMSTEHGIFSGPKTVTDQLASYGSYKESDSTPPLLASIAGGAKW